MNKEDRELQFREYIETCMNPQNIELIGLGNPYAKILLVGQESARKANNGDEVKIIRADNEDYLSKLRKGDWYNLYHHPRFYEDRKNKYGKRVLNRTWNAYQKLVDYIRPEAKRCKIVEKTDFCMDAFTTELNNTVSPHHALEWKPRIETFKHSDFIKGFPVVVLACSNYINEKQIIETFIVEPGIEHCYSKKTKAMRFKTYYSSDHSRLVIHTRQLSQYSEALLHGMADNIQNHFKEIGEPHEALSY